MGYELANADSKDWLVSPSVIFPFFHQNFALEKWFYKYCEWTFSFEVVSAFEW